MSLRFSEIWAMYQYHFFLSFASLVCTDQNLKAYFQAGFFKIARSVNHSLCGRGGAVISLASIRHVFCWNLCSFKLVLHFSFDQWKGHMTHVCHLVSAFSLLGQTATLELRVLFFQKGIYINPILCFWAYYVIKFKVCIDSPTWCRVLDMINLLLCTKQLEMPQFNPGNVLL